MLSKIKRRFIALVIAVAGLMLIACVSATPAQATTPELHLELAQYQPGEVVRVYADEVCPSSSATPYIVKGYFQDSSLNIWYQSGLHINNVASVQSNGEWESGWFIIPEAASTGTGTLMLDCSAGATTLKTYDPISVEVSSNSTEMAVTSGEPRPMEPFTISSVVPCPVQSEVHVRMYWSPSWDDSTLYTYDESFTVQSDVQGNWSHTYTAPAWIAMNNVNFFVRAGCYYSGGEYHYSPLKERWMGDYYVALGDSYSSGLGSGNYENTYCYTSPDAYAYHIEERLGLATPPRMIACAGAVTNDLWSGLFQMSQFDTLNSDVKLVTLTIGGNDAGFATVLRACLDTVSNIGYGCHSDSSVTGPLAASQAALAGVGSANANGDSWARSIHSINSVLAGITSRSTEAEVYIAGYPRLFGTSTSNYSWNLLSPSHYVCNVNVDTAATIRVDYNDALWMNDQVDILNQTVIDAVQDLQSQGKHVHYVPTDDFAGHGLCDNDTAWLNGVSLDGVEPTPESFHPNVVGIGSGYGTAFVDAM